MVPRRVLQNTFGLFYRKIPVVAIGSDVYCDTSMIIEALEHRFPARDGWKSVYPGSDGTSGDGWNYRGLVRGMVAWWTDRAIFRTTTGLIPASVWSTSFGDDRASLIGHSLSPSKLGAKIPQNLSVLDLHLSLLEPTVKSSKWLLPGQAPSLADISVYYQLRWGLDISAGKGIYNLTGGAARDTQEPVMDGVFNKERYPGLWRWFEDFESYFSSLPDLETTIDPNSSSWKQMLRNWPPLSSSEALVPSPAAANSTLDGQRGLIPGVDVSIAPDDTGRDDPTKGKLIRIGVEEIVIAPETDGEIKVWIHFPRLGFVVKVIGETKL